jgi:hypothetical protein
MPIKPSSGSTTSPEFDASTREIAGMLVDLGFEPVGQCERVRRRAGKADDDVALG